MEKFPRKIIVIGTSGCGKTTLASYLSKKLAIKNIDLDDLYWLPNWEHRSDEDFFNQITEVISSDEWIVCGNYLKFTKPIWKFADIIIWLDIPLSTCLWRALKRSLRRLLNKESCCNGNYESVARLVGKESILAWIWKTHLRRKISYNELLLKNKKSPSLIRLGNKKEIEKFRLFSARKL